VADATAGNIGTISRELRGPLVGRPAIYIDDMMDGCYRAIAKSTVFSVSFIAEQRNSTKTQKTIVDVYYNRAFVCVVFLRKAPKWDSFFICQQLSSITLLIVSHTILIVC
jgi:hypothetical protein